MGNNERVVWSFSEIENLPEKETLIWNVEGDDAVHLESPVSMGAHDRTIAGFRTYGSVVPSTKFPPQAHLAEREFSYKCSHCKKVLNGTRFVMVTEYRGTQ